LIRKKTNIEKNNTRRMNIKQTFVDLTRHTVPYKKEKEYLSDLLPMDILTEDQFGNFYIKIGKTTTMFAAHLDTVGGDKEVKHVFEGNMIKTDGTSVLGADDKAGVVIMLYMIEKKVPGLYVFFLGEEVGCMGSKALSGYLEKNKDKKYNGINKVISLDRKDIDSVITYQSSERCCSDEFADSLISELGKSGLKFKKDTGGVLTDSIQFTDLYAECTNLSVGYWSQHTNTERQDIDFLEKLAKACTKVDWESLTIKRKPGEVERLSYGRSSYGRSSYGGYYGGGYNDWDWEEDDYKTGGSGAGFTSNWSSTQNSRSSNNKSNSEYVKDWRGNKILSKSAVWCEHDNVYCLKKDAIWVDIIGFYTTPDEDTILKNDNSDDNNGKTEDYNTSKGKIILNGKELKKGDKVIHPLTGSGEIHKVSKNNMSVVINLDNGTKREYMLSIAKIKKI